VADYTPDGEPIPGSTGPDPGPRDSQGVPYSLYQGGAPPTQAPEGAPIDTGVSPDVVTVTAPSPFSGIGLLIVAAVLYFLMQDSDT
jgi:hypothetical protein